MRILIVDDDVRLSQMLAESLRQGRYDVDVAADGFEGLLKVGAFRPDVLVLDLRMPGLDGYQVCRAVKENRTTYGTKVLVITGNADRDARAQLAAAGADGLLEKPFHPPVLQATVQRLLASTQPAEATR